MCFLTLKKHADDMRPLMSLPSSRLSARSRFYEKLNNLLVNGTFLHHTIHCYRSRLPNAMGTV